jgi:hypothetical protein
MGSGGADTVSALFWPGVTGMRCPRSVHSFRGDGRHGILAGNRNGNNDGGNSHAGTAHRRFGSVHQRFQHCGHLYGLPWVTGAHGLLRHPDHGRYHGAGLRKQPDVADHGGIVQ